ncbi:hypothetical protein O0I10_009220 [Lichtheimia ornata]|uniref:Protein kinase domain-containing protein n=1 Tax=Lichtheimia ornata TaxID=688661 RepID=A0AAD7UXD5_9FUNG|nr:uncharacterized protein O0I10_009220 [Lichtheimia ornata]KAJ8655015.1 hypothetical protein O0I10_009220 [Lichtheimia ornata]
MDFTRELPSTKDASTSHSSVRPRSPLPDRGEHDDDAVHNDGSEIKASIEMKGVFTDHVADRRNDRYNVNVTLSSRRLVRVDQANLSSVFKATRGPITLQISPGGSYCSPISTCYRKVREDDLYGARTRSIDFEHVLAKRKNQPPDYHFIRHYWHQMLEAVATIHQENIVHSDLKPGNFILVDDTLKLIDFGLAKAIEDLHLEP